MVGRIWGFLAGIFIFVIILRTVSFCFFFYTFKNNIYMNRQKTVTRNETNGNWKFFFCFTSSVYLVLLVKVMMLCNSLYSIKFHMRGGWEIIYTSPEIKPVRKSNNYFAFVLCYGVWIWFVLCFACIKVVQFQYKSYKMQ